MAWLQSWSWSTTLICQGVLVLHVFVNIFVYITIQHCLQRVCVSIDKDREKKGVNVSLGRFLVRRRRKEEAFGDDSSPCLVLFNRSNSALVYQDCHMPFSFYLFA